MSHASRLKNGNDFCEIRETRVCSRKPVGLLTISLLRCEMHFSNKQKNKGAQKADGQSLAFFFFIFF